MRKTFIGLIFLCALAAFTVFSPKGLNAAISVVSAEAAEETKLTEYEHKLGLSRSALLGAVDNFNKIRSFDVYYGDVDKLVQIMKDIGGIEVKVVAVVDPMNNYSEVKWYEAGDEHNAIRLDLVVSDVNTTLSILERMELPIYTVDVQFPNQMSVIFLTGGEI